MQLESKERLVGHPAVWEADHQVMIRNSQETKKLRKLEAKSNLSLEKPRMITYLPAALNKTL